MRALLFAAAGAFGGAAVLALLLVPLVRALAMRGRLLDAPGGRKAHARPTVRLGGVAIVLAFLVPWMCFLVALAHDPARLPAAWTGPYDLASDPHLAGRLLGPGWSLALGLLVIHLTGVLDDLLGARFPWWAKLLGQVMAAAIAVEGGARLDLLVVPWLNAGASVLWIVTVANAMNFLDHADGICAGVGAIAASLLFAVAALLGQAAYALALAAFAGALVGFLVYNAPPATIFMGDGGSHAIGFVLASLTLLLSYVAPAKGAGYLPALLPVIVLGLPLFDLAVVVTRRLRRGQPIHVGDRTHLHHRLRRLGMSDWQATLAVWTATLALGGGAVALPFATWPGAVALFVQALATMGLIAMLMLFGERGAADPSESGNADPGSGSGSGAGADSAPGP